MIIDRYYKLLTGYDPSNPYDLKDHFVKYKLKTVEQVARRIWDKMDKNESGWDDEKGPFAELSGKWNGGNAETNGVGYNIANIYNNLFDLSLAWATVGSKLYHDEELGNDIVAAMNWVDTYRYGEKVEDLRLRTNWYQWEYSIPRVLNRVVVLMYDKLSEDDIQRFIAAEDRYTSPDPTHHMYKSDPPFQPISTGGNRAMQLEAFLVRAALGKDSEKIALATKNMDPLFEYVTTGDGMYEDGSFVQHNIFPYIGGYGVDQFSCTFLLLYLSEGTIWANTSPSKNNVFLWFKKAVEPTILDGMFLDSVKGRQAAGENAGINTAVGVIKQLLKQIEFTVDPTEVLDLKRTIKYYVLHSNTEKLIKSCTLWQIPRICKILNDGSIKPKEKLVGNFQYYNMDRVIHHRPEWVYSIAMFSDRIGNYESINGNNLKGWYTGNGMTYLYNDITDYTYKYWTTVDPYRLPGITVDRDLTRKPASNERFVSSNSWTGGTNMEGLYGIAGMDFKQDNYNNADLSAKKSWFMFEDKVVALGAGINSTSGRCIESIIDNRALNSLGNNKLVVNDSILDQNGEEVIDRVQWAYLEGTGGYVFPDLTKLHFLREERQNDGFDFDSQVPFNGYDEFNTADFQKNIWTILRENVEKHKLTGKELVIYTELGTLKSREHNLKNLYLCNATPQDFLITTSVDFTPTTDGQQAGLILYKDENNYVSVSKGSHNTVIVANEIDGTCLEQIKIMPNLKYLKLEKRGSNIKLYASDKEDSFGESIAEFKNNIGDAKYVNEGLKVGLFAQNGLNSKAESIRASFEYFRFKHIKSFMTIWKDHGIDPMNQSYSYIVLPKKTKVEVSAYSKNSDIKIIRNDETVQAVEEKNLGIIGMNFWVSGEVNGIKSYSPASVMLKVSSTGFSLSISDPTHKQKKVIIGFDKAVTSIAQKDDTIKVLSLTPIKFEINTSIFPGKAHSIEFIK